MASIVLGIETSCDESAVALFDPIGNRIVDELIHSQIQLHRPYDGVVPELASRQHLSTLPRLLKHIFVRNGLTWADIGGVGVTRGPGLKGCLLIGYMMGQAIARCRRLPFVGVNHLEGHVLAPRLDALESNDIEDQFSTPFLSMIVSGGHSEIVLVKDIGRYEVVTKTLDDAAGEAFDKAASLLGFPYPGGPALARVADEQTESPFKLPTVMRHRKDLSFSGLKTAISLLVKRVATPTPTHDDDIAVPFGYLTTEVRSLLAFEIQRAIVDALLDKLRFAIDQTGVTVLSVTGGVAANRCLRAAVQRLGYPCSFPIPRHATDNAAMIAYVASLRLARGEITPFGQEVKSSWPLSELP